MNKKHFTHLHLHTLYSFFSGTIKMEDLFKRVNELEMKKIAITDHGNMHGTAEFYILAKKYNVKPIVGIELYIINEQEEENIEKDHLILLAENKKGYENLLKLLSFIHVYERKFETHIFSETLKQFKDGIVALSACLKGEVAKYCVRNKIEKASKAIEKYKEIFRKKNFFLEIQLNNTPIQNKVNKDFKTLSKKYEIKIVCTNNCHYLLKDDYNAQRMLKNMKKRNRIIENREEINIPDSELYVKSEEEIKILTDPEYNEAFENTCELGERCNIDIQVGRDSIPITKIPQEFKTHAEYLNHLTYKGLKTRFNKLLYKISKRVYNLRLYSELRIINDMGYSNYFLIVYNFTNWAKNNKIKIGPGRGSASGSLVSYCLEITNLDPLLHGLVFERFLNAERASMPDFDIDFMQEKRDKMIKYVASLYGALNIGQIATFSKFTPKSTIKDVSKSLGVPFEEINLITKELPILVEGEKPTFEQLMGYAKRLKEMAQLSATYQDIIKISRILDGLHRQAGMHAAGVVISNKNLITQTPLFIGINNEIITQFDKDSLDFFGLTKFDFLGLKTLDFISKIENYINIRIIRENGMSFKKKKIASTRHIHMENLFLGTIDKIDLDLISLEDKFIFKLLSSGNTLGIFQFESPGFQQLCLKLQPDCLNDIIAAAALYRPGPIQSGLLNEFIIAKHKPEKEYFHEKLKDALIETYGKFVYQEQVISSAEIIAGYSTSEADIFRNAITKKEPKELLIQKEKFVFHAIKREMEKKEAEEIFDYIEKFAGYGFNKSHATSYAMMTYQTAFFKFYYTVEFITSMLDLYVTSTDDIVNYINEAKKNNIKVLKPNINRSKKKFKIEYSKIMYIKEKDKKKEKYAAIRFGLEGVKGLNISTLDSILEEKKSKKFKNLTDFYIRIETINNNKKAIQCLIKSGALDVFKCTRKFKFDTIDNSLYDAKIINIQRNTGQRSLFFNLKNEKKQKKIEELQEIEWPTAKLLEGEFDVMGLYITTHPIDLYKKIVDKYTVDLIQDIRYFEVNKKTKIIIIVVEVIKKNKRNKKNRWIELNTEDRTGRIKVLCPLDEYLLYDTFINNKIPVMMIGKVFHEYKKDAKFGEYVAKIRVFKIKTLN